MRRKLTGLVLLAVLLSGCAAQQAFRKGENAVHGSDWDAAVTYFTVAVQANPDNAEYKLNLKRAQEEAARMHAEKARDLEAKDQLEAALTEYRRSLELVGTDRVSQAKVADLERKIRERVDATRPKPRIDQLRTEARNLGAPPLLNPASREPLRLSFNNASLRDILNFIATASGINVTYDQNYLDKPFTVTLEGVTVEEALQQVLSANQFYYKITNPRTILVIPDTVQKHQQYDEMVMKTFFINHADATDLAQVLNSMIRIQGLAVVPFVFPNKAANTIVVRATIPMMDIIERLIRANDKPRAEVLLDIEILEVNRNRLKRYGINLSAYALNFMLSPEVAPPNTSATPGTPAASPPMFNLNTISQGVSTQDFYLGVPTAVVNFLESDNHTKTLAKPQLRGADGNEMTLNLGSDIPVLSTVFGAAAAGGFNTIPQSSYNYKTIGVNLDIKPRVTYDGQILLELSVENSAVGPTFDVGGQSAQSFTTRKVHTFLRLREGEANLLAGLIKQDDTNNRSGLPGIMRVPGFKQLFSSNEITEDDTDIVMLITPHIVRDHDLTTEDVAPMYIGTQTNIGLGGPPQLIAPIPEAPQSPGQPSGTGGIVNGPPAGVAGPPLAAPLGAQPLNPPVPAGTTPVPGFVPPSPPPAAGNPPSSLTPPVPGSQPANPPAGVQPPTGVPPGAVPPITTPPVPETPVTTTPAPRDVATQPNATPTTPATAAQIIVTPPGTEFRVAGGPYTVPLSVNNASGVSVMSLTVTYNPAVIRVRTVQDGTFMRQGGVTASFTPKIDAAAGRVDIAIARSGDQTGASGAGLLAALLFDALAPGSSAISVTGVASGPDGKAVTLTFAPVTVTVR